MSKKKTKRKRNSAPKPKKKNYKSLITSICVILAIAVAIGIGYIYYLNTSLAATDFANTQWKSTVAYDASSDEVDMQEVYNNRYDNYQGSMELKGDGTFSFWMSPGDPDDGTHKGIYTYNRDKQILSVKYDGGEKSKFKIIRNSDNAIDHIEVPYNNYNVWFYLK